MRLNKSLFKLHFSRLYLTVFLYKFNIIEASSSFSRNFHLGRRLEVCPMYTINGTSLAYCTDSCLYYTKCLAVNYLPKESYCEMLDTNKGSKPPETFISVAGYMYVDVNDWTPVSDYHGN